MGNVNDKLAYIAGTKTAIKDAIVAKGVAVPEETTFREYADKIGLISGGGGGGSSEPWTKPEEWPDISNVADNEINLLVTDGTGIAFTTTVADSGTYSIDWGDGTIETGCVSGATKQHQYNYTGGTNCPTLGYMVYKIRIYAATGNITVWKVARHTYTTRQQYHAILWAVFGTTAITDYSNTFYISGTGVQCRLLEACAIPSFGSVMDTSNMFFNCTVLSSITLPSSWGSVTNTSGMFQNCYALKTITNLEYLGSQSTNTDGSSLLRDCQFLQEILTLGAKWTKIDVYGASGFLLQCTGIRLTNATSPFTGSSPQVNVSYTSLNAAALDLLFGDLPTLTGKTINITGCPGAATCTRSIATGKGWTVTG